MNSPGSTSCCLSILPCLGEPLPTGEKPRTKPLPTLRSAPSLPLTLHTPLDTNNCHKSCLVELRYFFSLKVMGSEWLMNNHCTLCRKTTTAEMRSALQPLWIPHHHSKKRLWVPAQYRSAVTSFLYYFKWLTSISNSIKNQNHLTTIARNAVWIGSFGYLCASNSCHILGKKNALKRKQL